MNLNKAIEYIEWLPEWSTGNDLMDSQHKTLVNYINEMIMLSKQGSSSSDAISNILTKIKDYTIYHFKSEEKLLSNYNFLHLEQHKKIHENLIDQLELIEMKFLQVGTMIVPTLLNFLTLWLREHILGIDMKYARIVSKRAIP